MAEGKDFFATGPISRPVVVPELEDASLNGFAWSDEVGLLIEMGDARSPSDGLSLDWLYFGDNWTEMNIG